MVFNLEFESGGVLLKSYASGQNTQFDNHFNLTKTVKQNDTQLKYIKNVYCFRKIKTLHLQD
ncbi:hypothetical protein CHX27_04785 [Flavobacterium aurantiibacter]|uniref:Uncharacterized protein n=1 Tax=Flavobacterium aurantiibacter TaxID=2023067 RepID=A0A255ZZ40_9FLAO|nr:hypothetical protein CHX27_15040 [Flavobacterium aurantiibacter]OYQ46155.1 hypothetical protein CHX27_04785 [Flavobacterium aurantiibacter]